MANPEPPPPMRKGDTITASWLNSLRAIVLRNQIQGGVGCGLNISPSPNGTALSVAGASSSRGAVAIVNSGGISARSGTTAGTGTVTVQQFDGTDFYDSAVTNLDVISFSSTTGGIPAAAWVWIDQDSGGNWVVNAVDCGN